MDSLDADPDEDAIALKIDADTLILGLDWLRLNKYDEDTRLETYRREVQSIRAVNDELIRQAQLRAALDNNEAESTRIRLERLKYEGKLGQPELDKHAADRTLQDRNNQRDTALAQAQGNYDGAWSREDEIGRQLHDKTTSRDKIANDPRYMSNKDYMGDIASSAALGQAINNTTREQIKQAEKAVQDVQAAITRVKYQWLLVPKELEEDLRKKQADLEQKKNTLKEQEERKKELDKKTKALDSLATENDLEGHPEELEKKVKTEDEAIQSLAKSLDEAGENTLKYKNALDDLQKVQEGEKKNDEEEHKNQLSRINQEERKQQLEDAQAAAEKLRQENEATTASFKTFSDQLRASRMELAKQTGDVTANAPMTPQGKTMSDRIQAIAAKPDLDPADETELLRYKTLMESSGSRNTAASKQLQSALDQLVKNFDTERLARERAARSVQDNLGRIRGLDNKAAGDQARQDTTDVYGRVKDELTRNRKPDGTRDSREDEAARTVALIRRALEDNTVSGKERTALVAELQGWLADISAWGEDSVNAPLRDLLRQIVSGYSTARQEGARTAATVREMQQEYSALKSRLDNKSS